MAYATRRKGNLSALRIGLVAGAAAAAAIFGAYMASRQPLRAKKSSPRLLTGPVRRPVRGWWQRHDLHPARFDLPNMAPDNLNANRY